MASSMVVGGDAAYERTTLRDFQRDAIGLIWPAIFLVGLGLIVVTEVRHGPLREDTLGLILIATALLTWGSLRYSYAAGVGVLIGGSLLAVNQAWVVTSVASAGALLVLPTALAAFLAGAAGGIAAATCASLLVIQHGVSAPAPLLAAIWGIVGVVRLLLLPTRRAIEWSWASYQQARRLLDEAREQSLELQQTKEDLIQANLQLTRLSDQLRILHQMAEDARRAKEEFVANVSHELRTPLNMIIGFSEVILQSPHVYGAPLPPALQADIAVIQRNSQHLASLVNDVLDLSQVDAGRMALSKEWVSLAQVVEEAMVAVEPLFRSKGLTLEAQLPPDLPPLYCDRTRVRQVVLNLLSNAGRFTERGGARVEARREGRTLIVSVADTGPGVSAEDQKRIFAPFQQLDGSLRRRHGGSGLGLSISKAFVELHSGRMWVESVPGQGTVFNFSLPITEPVALDGNDVARWFSPYQTYEGRTRPSRAPKPQLRPRLILLDADDTLARLLARYQEGVDLVICRDAERAVAEAQVAPARALLVNEATQGRASAWEQRLADVPASVPILRCNIPGEATAAERLGVASYLIKPIGRERLLEALAATVSDGATVLVVDDEPEVVQLIGRMLLASGRGYRVLRALDGQRALDLLRERRPDVMLLDLMMPGKDGFAVLQEKNEDAALRSIPVIAISARDPAGESTISNALTVTRSSGLSSRDLLACIDAISEALAVVPRQRSASGDRAVPEKLPG